MNPQEAVEVADPYPGYDQKQGCYCLKEEFCPVAESY